MRLIADSGSTSTDWHLIREDGTVEEFSTIGLSPFFVSKSEIENAVRSELQEKLDTSGVREIHFYGAGCSSDERCKRVLEALSAVFGSGTIEINHDLLGAARAALGQDAGIVAILGTGSNSAHYDGEYIMESIPALGYVLGDEGSGAHMGKKLLKAYLSEKLDDSISRKLTAEYQLTKDVILDTIYTKPKPNTYLASFARFVGENRDNDQIDKIARSSINDFFERHICQYPGYAKLSLGFVGSIAHHFSDVIRDIAKEKGIELGKIIVKPIGELVAYHRYK